MDEGELLIEMRRNNDLTPTELKEIDEVCRLSFTGDGGEAYTWSASHWHVIGRMDGRIVSSIEIVDRQAKVGSQPVRLGGIGGVATHPDYRRRGYASALMNHAADFMHHEMKVDFGLLFCGESKIHLYGSVGWQVIKGPVMVDQPGGKIVFDAVTMFLPCVQSTWPEGVVDICGLPW